MGRKDGVKQGGRLTLFRKTWGTAFAVRHKGEKKWIVIISVNRQPKRQ